MPRKPQGYSVKVEHEVPIRLRDGTITYANVFRPDAPGKFPALLHRTPYDKYAADNYTAPINPTIGAQNGYAVIIQDVRGRYASEGDFTPFFNEEKDGYDSVEWAAGQPWCTGKVGMTGISYGGATQWLTARGFPPSLAAVAPGYTASDYHEGWAWQGGAFELGFNLSWSVGALTAYHWDNLAKKLKLTERQKKALIAAKDDLNSAFAFAPLKDAPYLKDGLAPYYYDWLAHPDYDRYWKSICIQEAHTQLAIPAFNYGGWYDVFLGGTVNSYQRLSKLAKTKDARLGQRLLIGPWVHLRNAPGLSGDYWFGTNAAALVQGLPDRLMRFFDHWLKGVDTGMMDEKPVRVFTMGEGEWHDHDDWPPPQAVETAFYLHSGGKANTLNGDGMLSTDPPGGEPPDAYAYNPLNPVPTVGGQLCCDPAFMRWGAYDQRSVEARPDVLVYSTPPLKQDIEVTGPVSVTLFAASSARDTDFTAKLVDVEPSGYVRNLTDGIVRARYRRPRTPAGLIEPGRIYEYTIDAWHTSNLFRKGHQIRLEISSSNFPRFDRNANTGGPIGADAPSEFKPALQTVHHDATYPSHVKLFVVPRK
jgi:putative CocE/NonD family hydrolase